MEELKQIPGETIKSALKELCIKTGMNDEMFNELENPQECFEYLSEFYTPEAIVKHVTDKHKKGGGRSKRRRRSKRKGSKKKRSKKRRTRKY